MVRCDTMITRAPSFHLLAIPKYCLVYDDNVKEIFFAHFSYNLLEYLLTDRALFGELEVKMWKCVWILVICVLLYIKKKSDYTH